MTVLNSKNNGSVESSRSQPTNRKWLRLFVACGLVLLPLFVVYHFWGRCQYVVYRLESLIQQVRISEAVELARKRHPNLGCPEVCLLAVRAHRMAGDVQAADRLLAEYESIIDSPLRISRERTLNKARRGQLNGVDSQLAALLRDPEMDSRDVSESFAVGFRLNRRLEEAAMLVEAWKQDWPTDYRPHYHEGLMRQTLTNWELAIVSYRTAIKLAPLAVDCRVRLGECLSQLHQDSEAVEQFKLVIERDPANQTALLGLANGLKQQGEFAAARKSFLKLLQLDPGSFASRLAIAQIDFENDDLDSAYQTAVSLSAIWPEDVATLYLLSQTQVALNETTESEKTLERWSAADGVVQQVEADIQVLATRANDIDLQVSIGARMMKHYSREMGHQFIGAALQIRPEHPDAASVLRDHLERQERVRSLPLPTTKASQ